MGFKSGHIPLGCVQEHANDSLPLATRFASFRWTVRGNFRRLLDTRSLNLRFWVRTYRARRRLERMWANEAELGGSWDA